MKASIANASARQDSGEPSVVPDRGGSRNNRPRNPDAAEVEREIAALLNRSTQELRLTWRQLHHTGPPLGLSRDLLIRALAHQRQVVAKIVERSPRCRKAEESGRPRGADR